MDPVIVVGAGPVGLALALVLARHAVPSVVLERGDGQVVRRAARTCVLRPDTAALLPPLEAARWRAWRAEQGRQQLEQVALDEETAPYHLEQHRLERVLRAALDDEELVRLETGTRLEAVEQDDSGVTAHTRGPGPASWRGSHLVGCDGARSTVRKLLGVGFPGRTSVERQAVAAVRVRLPWPGEALLQRQPGRQGGEVTARPLPDGAWRLDWLLEPRGPLVTPEEMLDRVHDTLAGWQAAASEDLSTYEILDTGVHTAHQRLARRWRVDRVFLAGDSAHLVGALGVQAVDEGLRDVADLAWKLALVRHERTRDGDAAEVLLDSYEIERRAALAARLRAVDQALPFVRRSQGALRGLLPGSARGQLGLLTDGHLGRGRLGGPPSYARSPLAVPEAATAAARTAAGAPVLDVPVTLLDGTRGRLRDRLYGRGADLLVVFVAPGTAVWDSRHWLTAGLMPELASAVDALPLRAELAVAERYPGAAAHTALLVRADGHLVAAFPATRPETLRECADVLRGVVPARQ